MKKVSLLFTLCLLLGTGSANAQHFSVIYTFHNTGDGSTPSAGVTLRQGSLYGITYSGFLGGTVYQMTPAGSGWTFTPISDLSNGGYGPVARMVFGPDGHPYGAANYGGTCENGGFLFDLIPPPTLCKSAKCYWGERVAYQFACSSSDGASPGYGDLVWDRQGNMYGTTEKGGDFGQGTVYQLQPSGSNWTENILYSFSGADGKTPLNGVIFDGNGNLFGTTGEGGSKGFGTVYELTYQSGVGWTEKLIHDFQNGSDGNLPIAGLLADASGNFYGAVRGGGSGGSGTIFELSPSGNSWTFKVLYSFSGLSYCGPWASLSMDAAGNLYGTTYCGGAHQQGSVFRLSNTQNGWVYSSLYDFTGGPDGGLPVSNVSIDTNGNLYGTASKGGSLEGQCSTNQGCGTVWQIKP